MQFLHEHVEGLGNSGLRKVLTLHDRLVDPAASVHVVRLHRENFLKYVRGAVRLQRPHLHLPESLSAELRLAGERLLRDQRVRADAPRVNLVVDQVRQLEHVDLADRDREGERLAAAAIAEPHLAVRRETGEPHQLLRRGIDVQVRLLTERRRERGQLLHGEQVAGGAAASLLELTQRALVLRSLRRSERLVLGGCRMETDLVRDFL